MKDRGLTRALMGWLLVGLTVWLALVLCGCDKRRDRAQAGADIVSGIKAARVALEAGYATQEVLNILQGVEKYVPAATCINPKEWPSPRMTPAQILSDPAEYDKSSPPVPEPSTGIVGWLLGAAPVALWIIGRLAPSFPVLGPVAGKIADVAWTVLASRGQKADDQPKDMLRGALEIACRLADEQEAVARDAAKDLGDEAGSDALEKVAANKRAAAILQRDAGVHSVTQRARGKA